MIAPKKARGPEAHNSRGRTIPYDDSLSRKIEDLAQQERDAVRRRDWSSARVAAEERVVLQTARQRAAAKRLS